jgi:hypothetical protein
MAIFAPKDVAMVLPLPVKQGTGEDGVIFINLESYPEFFRHLSGGFPAPHRLDKSVAGLSRGLLDIQQVGSFEASFVPTVDDFSRLDPRFQLPRETWDKLPGFRKSGFAVFKLKPGKSEFHPMAFSFPRANVNSLFFPTLHIHDGKAHLFAHFDHVLYCQLDSRGGRMKNWTESSRPAWEFVAVQRANQIVDGGKPCFQKKIRGIRLNRDTVVSLRT